MGRDKIQCGALTVALRLGLELGNITFSDTSVLSGEDSGTRFADQAGQPLPLASLLILSERASGRRSRPLKGMRERSTAEPAWEQRGNGPGRDGGRLFILCTIHQEPAACQTLLLPGLESESLLLISK